MSPSPSPSLHPSSSLTILLIALIIVFFFLGFLLICLCKFLTQNLFNNLNSPTVNLVVVNSSNGLEPSLVQAFPTFIYSTVKEIRQDTKYGLECAICLSEFEDDSMLRLLTVCYHVFHKECVDLWLESHKTCPVCRRDLDLPSEKLLVQNQSPQHGHSSPMPSIQESDHEDAVSINIEDDEREDVSEDGSEGRGGQSTGCARTMSRKQSKMDSLPRSNSTGHSIGRRNELLKGQEKYTLRLSDHVKFKIVRGHTGSCITFGEFSENKRSSNVRFAEALESSDDNYGESSKS